MRLYWTSGTAIKDSIAWIDCTGPGVQSAKTVLPRYDCTGLVLQPVNTVLPTCDCTLPVFVIEDGIV